MISSHGLPRLLITVVFISTLSTSTLFCQVDNSEAKSLFEKAAEFSNKYQRDSAIWYYTSAAESYLTHGDSIGYYSSNINVAFEYGSLGRFAEAYPILDKILPIYKGKASGRVKYELYATYGQLLEYEGRFSEAIEMAEIAIDSNYELDTEKGKGRNAKLLYRKGFAQLQSRRFQEAVITMEASRAIFKELGRRGDEAAALSQIGSLYVQLLKADEALKYFNECKQIHLSMPDSITLESKASLSLNIGDAYRALELFPEAISNLLHSADQFGQVQKDHPAFTVVYPQLGFTYERAGEYDKAIEYLEKGVALCLRYYGKSNFRTITNQQILGIAYASNAEHRKAIEQFKSAISVLETDLAGAAPDILAKLVFEKGRSQYKIGEVEIGLKNMGKGIAMSKGDGLHLIRQVTLLSIKLGQYYLELNKGDSARKYYQLALDVNSNKVKESKPNPQMAFHFNRYESFLGKAAGFELLYEESSNVYWLDSAYNMLKKAEDEVSFFRQFPSRLTEQLEIGSELSESFDAGVRICYKLFELTQRKEYAEYAYQLIEQSKSNQAFFNTDSQVSLNLPEALRLKESQLNISLSSFETLLYQELSKEEPNQEEISKFENKVEDTTDEMIRLSQQIRTDYPGYYQLKYDREYLDIEETQKLLLSESELLLNYHYSQDALFLFKISLSGFSFEKLPLKQNFEESVFGFVELLKKPGNAVEDVNEYVKASDELSKSILAKLDTSVQSVIVIPDGPLHLIPFGAMLKSNVEVSNGFRDLPYLIKDFNFRYGTSASMLAKQASNQDVRNGKVIAFAPSFSENSMVSDSVRSSLGNLGNTKREVESIESYFETDVFVDADATEKLFRNSARDYSIIHLASHGITDPENALFSKLLFSPFDTDSINDGFLNTREILSMSIPANMVVLSACNTGSGDLIKGEGVMSLANGFSYAGAKSLIMTLWPANDESTANIMDSFYSSLSAGNDKSISLRNAKIAYLDNANMVTSHPYYWAHFVLNGDDKPLVSKGISTLWWLLLLLPVAYFITSRLRSKSA